MPPHNERAAAPSTGLSGVRCLVNNAAADGGLKRIIYAANAMLGLAALNEVLSKSRRCCASLQTVYRNLRPQSATNRM